MSKSKKYLTANQTLARYGGASRMWLWRKLKHDDFPPPVRFGGRGRFFDEELLDRWDEMMASREQAVTSPKVA